MSSQTQLNEKRPLLGLIKAAADSIDGTLSHSAQEYILNESEKYLQSVINDVSSLMRIKRNTRLGEKHINLLLKARHEEPLLGYSTLGKYEDYHQAVTELSYPFYHTINFEEDLQPTIKFIDRNTNFKVDYMKVENFELGELPANGKINSKHKSDKSKAEGSEYVNGALNKNQVDFINETMYYMRNSMNNSFDVGLKQILESEEKINPLIPYFIHIITGKMTTQYHNIGKMIMLTKMSAALASNPNIDLPTFFHPFLRICMSALIGSDVGSNESDDDSEVRREAAHLLAILREKCSKAYPAMIPAIYNKLAEVLFNHKTSVATHVGSIYGFIALGQQAVHMILPHLQGYIRGLVIVSKNCSYEKSVQIQSAVDAIHELVLAAQQNCDEISIASNIERINETLEEIFF